ncbi:MAG: hypothetical protein ACOC86_01370 [Candidatus Bipolaricaulota bacterium]
MKLAEKIPLLGKNGEGETKKGRVRLLGKIGQGKDFEPDDFNKLVKVSVRHMDENREDEKVLLDDEIDESIAREDLLDRHLSYRIKVGRTETISENGNRIIEGPTFKVIMREQPSRSIEINGPGDISLPFKETLRSTFRDLFSDGIHFENILNDKNS